MPWRTLRNLTLVSGSLLIGYLSADVIKSTGSANSARRAQVVDAQVCKAQLGSEPVEVDVLQITSVLTRLWEHRIEPSFRFTRVQDEGRYPLYRFLVNSDVGGLIVFCQSDSNRTLVGLVEMAPFSVGAAFNQPDASRDRHGSNVSPWFAKVVVNQEQTSTIAYSNVFGDAVVSMAHPETER